MHNRNNKTHIPLKRIAKPLSLILIIAVFGSCLVLLFCRAAGIVSNVRVSPTGDGYIYAGSIEHWTLGISKSKHACLIMVERYERKLDSHFANDLFYITAFSLADGKRLFRHKLTVAGDNRLQAARVWTWHENIVLWGYHQEQPGHLNELFSITILDSQGNLKRQFPITGKPKALDDENGILVCEPFPIKLSSGDELSQPRFSLMVDAVSDGNGNAFILRRVKEKKDRHDTKDIFDAYVEKYSTDTWEKEWVKMLSGTENAYSIRIRYANGLLWYATSVKATDSETYKRQIEWLSEPLEAATGDVVAGGPLAPPPQTITDTDGKRYVVSKEDEGLLVRVVTD